MRPWLLSSALSLGLLLASEGRALGCRPVQVRRPVAELPAAWQQALDALVAASGDAAQPWGCSGGQASLRMSGEGAVLSVERPGAAPMSRPLSGPGELLPAGKAMLARAEPPVPPPAPAPPAEPPPPDAAEPDAPPRAYVEASGAGRYAAITSMMALGGAVAGRLPIGRWSAGLWLRYLVGAAGLTDAASATDYAELGIGAQVGYDLLRDPVGLRAGLYGALVVVDMESQLAAPAGQGDNEVGSGAVDGRAGMELALAVPIASVLSAVLAVDGDMAPASLGHTDRRLDPALPPLPAYTLGLRAGLQVGVP